MFLKSRRQFLGLSSVLPFIGICPLFFRRAPITRYLDQEFVLVQGWVLKKSDLSKAARNDY